MLAGKATISKLSARIICNVLKIFHSIESAPDRKIWRNMELANCADMASLAELT